MLIHLESKCLSHSLSNVKQSKKHQTPKLTINKTNYNMLSRIFGTLIYHRKACKLV